ncbi:hypothetical protein HN51_003322 [Arachis hypogaea]|nr:uncharacterized protein DS421_1g33110 [Arachis hypogaea]
MHIPLPPFSPISTHVVHPAVFFFRSSHIVARPYNQCRSSAHHSNYPDLLAPTTMLMKGTNRSPFTSSRRPTPPSNRCRNSSASAKSRQDDVHNAIKRSPDGTHCAPPNHVVDRPPLTQFIRRERWTKNSPLPIATDTMSR